TGQDPEPDPDRRPDPDLDRTQGSEPAPAPGPTPEPAAPHHPGSPGSLTLARALLGDGKYEQAIRASHLAWREAPDRPDVFLEMIDIHCEAAMADHSPAHFPDAERWLKCANSHDPSNPKVRDHLAERSYIQAAELARQGHTRQALKTLAKALEWSPDHPASRALHHRLTKDTARPKRGKQ
ncbi:tetratricopeptide repeat protein, partial [Streptomyces iconiensis]